jgi:Ca2+-binding RTX toxin-like protein
MGVLDVNGPPTAPSLSANIEAENAHNGTVVGALSATDPDGNPLTFSLTSNPGGKFGISGSNLVVAGAIDFETATSHTVTVQVSDGQGGTASPAFTINLTNLSDPSAGDDTLNGTAGADTINGLAGNDRIYGLIGPDLLNGGAGRDDLQGGKGSDVLIGGDGLDFLQDGDDTRITIGANRITLLDFDAGDLRANMFDF